MSNRNNELATWVIYSNIHLLRHGGLPNPCDMMTFAPKLWQEHTKEKAVQFVWNDDGLDPQTYIKQMERVGFRANTTHVTDDSEIVDEDAYMDLCALKTDLWLEAVRALAAGIENQRRGLRESFDTSGLSAHGIVPRQKMRIE